nr:type secretion system protein [Aeromicrobium sp.]
MSALAMGVLCVALALGALSYGLLASTVPRVPIARRTLGDRTETTMLGEVSEWLVKRADGMLRRRGWAPFHPEEIELAGLRMSASSLVVTIGLGTLAGAMVGSVVTGSILGGLFFAVLVPVGAKAFLSIRAGKRRQAFADQLDATLQMLASALRAGHSLPKAFDAAAKDSVPPMSEELGRIVNEHRLGRDLVQVMELTGERMANEEFVWVSQAVAIQRDTGGNLNEVLDQVGETIRERSVIKSQVRALSAEGRMSAYILMALPIVIGALFSVMNPSYMAPLVNQPIGLILLGACAVMLALGGLWLRKIADIKV